MEKIYKNKATRRATLWAKANPGRRREISRNSARKINGSTEESLEKSATWLGRKWEKIFSVLLGAIDMNESGMGKPFDLLWKDKKINLKVANLYLRKMKRGKILRETQGWWRFNPSIGKCDFYLCVCLEEEEIKKMYLIPNHVMPSKGITIGHKCEKYKKYLFLIK